MYEPLSLEMQQRLLLLSRYLQAVSQGDLEAIGQVLSAATCDEVLERMLLEANANFQEQLHTTVQPAELLSVSTLVAEAARPLLASADPVDAGRANGGYTATPHFRSNHRKPRRERRISGIVRSVAAVLIVGLLVGSFLALFATRHQGSSGSPGGAHTTGSEGGWHVVPNPEHERLQGIMAISANDAWAVGGGGIEHWDGQQWRIVLQNDGLQQLAGTAANDIWAVGQIQVPGSPGKGIYTLTMHWNGKQWSHIPDVNLPGGLTGVTAIAADDAWAVGYSLTSQDTPNLLIEHWDGQHWSIVPVPHPGATDNELFSMTALSADDVWAVGYASYNQPGKEHTITLIEHWDGQRWSVVPSPNATYQSNLLNAVSATSANDVWAVGDSSGRYVDGSMTGDGDKALIEHWDGQHWSIVPGPQLARASDLYGVAAISTRDVWAVGFYDPADKLGSGLIEHWDGQRWSVVSRPHPGESQYLFAVARIPDSDTVWVAGSYYQYSSPVHGFASIGAEEGLTLLGN